MEGGYRVGRAEASDVAWRYPLGAMLRLDAHGLVCEAGGFHVDPWQPVPLAVITHAHADHCRPGCGRYVVAEDGLGVVRKRLGPDVQVDVLGYGDRRRIGEVTVSLHPAGHVLGSAQVLVEGGGERFLVTGDYKREIDPTCRPFSPVRADVLITEATFGLPIYRWPAPDTVTRELLAIHEAARAEGRSTVVFAYALGKAQRLLSMLASSGIEVHVHGAIAAMNEVYRASGVPLPEAPKVIEADRARLKGALVLAPLSARGTPFMRRFTDPVEVLASGWMRVRGDRRRRALDHGLVLSDHADWPALLCTVAEVGAQRVLVTHGHTVPFARYLREISGLDAQPLEAHAWTGEAGAESEAEPSALEQGAP